MQTFDTILYPIQFVVAWIMFGFHELLTAAGLPAESGAAWALSIVGLVIVMRILLIPLFVKQIKASRGMQLIAPDMQKIQKKYKGKSDPASREAMTRETMELYKKHGTNPFASCLPILAQSPIFFALFRVLFNLGNLSRGEYYRDSIGPITQEVATQANSATLFGAPISSYFLEPGATTQTRIVTVLLIIAMSATTFLTQKQLTQKNMPAAALTGPMAQQQKMLLYLLPVIFAVTGVNFPIGVLIYWTTTNIWSMGQQFYVIRRNPTPGSQAERQLKERRRRKAEARGEVLEEDKPPVVEEKPRGQRQQPKRKHRTRPPQRPAGVDGGDEGVGDGSVAPDAGDSTTPPAEGDVDGAPRPRPEGDRPRKPRKRTQSPGTSTGAAPTASAGGAKPTAGAAGGKPSGARPAGTKPSSGKPAARKPSGSGSTAGGARGPRRPAGDASGQPRPKPRKPKPEGGSPSGDQS
jgi:YidC/Oxa1 family membrane protein insertase